MSGNAARLRILSVEDEPLNRLLLRAVLEHSNNPRLREADLVEASTVAEGRRRFEESEHDVILLDRRLPDGDGFQLAREAKARGAGSRPVIIALTADAVPATRAAAAAAGCAVVVVKPYLPAELTSTIAQLLESSAETEGEREPGSRGAET